MKCRQHCLFAGIVITVLATQTVFAQTSVDKRVSDISNSKLNDDSKLQQLYLLKNIIELEFGKRDTSYIKLLLTIATFESVKQNYSVASALALKSLSVIHNSASRPPATLILKSYSNAATYFYASNLYNSALRYYDTVIELSSATERNVYLLDARYYRACINDLFGDFEKVIDDSKLGLNEAKSQNDTESYKSFLYFLTRSLMQQDQLDLALERLNEFIRLSESTKDSFQMASAYSIKALICQKQRSFLYAEKYFKQALCTLSDTSYNYSAKSIIYNDLGVMYAMDLHKFKKAEACFQQVIKYSDLCTPEDRNSKKFLAICNFGDMYAITGNHLKAIFTYGQSLQYYNINSGDFIHNNPTLKQLKLVVNKENLLSVFSSKSDLLLKLYKTSGNKIYLQNCVQTSKLADSFITQMRHEQLGEKSKLYWRNKTHKLFSVAMEACFNSGDIYSAFYFMEKSRSVLLSDKLNELASHASYLTSTEVDKERNLQIKTQLFEKQLSAIPPSSAIYRAAEEELLRTKEELENYIKSLEKSNPQYYQYKYADDIPAISDLKQYLKNNNQSFVYYFAGDSALYVLGITKDKTTFTKVSAQSFDSRQLAQFTSLCSNRQENNNNYKRFSSLSYSIYKNIFEPLHLPPGNVTVCTDNFFIPFDALCSDNLGKEFLIYRYNFSYAYSARTFLKPFQSHAKPAGDFIGFAPVSFSKQLNVFPLKNSAVSLQNVAAYYGTNKTFTYANASRRSFFQEASHYTIVTVFSHAQADTTGKEPVLYMQDSLIHLSELQKLDNPATQFVLLSACQTNTGKNATGEGIYSLARGFAAAGIPSVSATLWNANEEVIYSISTKFNEYLAAGMNKSEALQKAKVWYLQNSSREHKLPFYWANMVLIGSTAPIHLTQTNHNWIWPVFTITLFSVSAAIYRYKRREKTAFFKTKK